MKIKPVSKDDYIDSAEQYANAANGYIKENATFIEISMSAWIAGDRFIDILSPEDLV